MHYTCPALHLSRLWPQDWLLAQGFRHVEDKSGVSLYINQQATNAGYTISFTNNSG